MDSAVSRPLIDIISDELWNKYYIPQYTAPIPVEVKTNYKISICTNSMDRVENLKQTFIQNIQDNIDYPNIEFVLLNYGSKDGINDWAKENLSGYIEKGIVNYYQISARHYSMSHSRNLTFKLATGDIVLNVDSDHFTNKGFAFKINELANQIPNKVVFVKSARRNRGRLGFFKKDFVALGGYDEDLIGYGFDDKDLLMRAFHSGFKIIWHGSDFCRMIENHRPHSGNRYQYLNWRYTQDRNAILSLLNLVRGRYVANEGRGWGRGKLIKNFKEIIKV